MNSEPLINFFHNLRLPIQRDGQDMLTFLRRHFLKFDNELGTLLDDRNNDSYKQIYDELKEKKESIKEFSKALLESLELYRNGRVLEAHAVFENKMDEIQDNLLGTEIRGEGIRHNYYRIRPDKGEKRKDLFHIPFNEITKVKAYRYSIAGFPCLYLAGSQGADTALSLCWFESGMPDKFYWSEFRVDKKVLPLYLVDFTATPFFGAMNPRHLVTSALNNQPIKEFTVKMITTYPLMAACSLIVEERNQNFIPEYIIPQMLLGWVRKNGKYRGIAYFSCSRIKSARSYTAFNIAMPPAEVKDNGHCQKLKREFQLSTPQELNISNTFKSLENDYLQIKSTYDKIYRTYQSFGFKSLQDAKSICENFLLVYPLIQSKKLQNIELAYQCIETLNYFAQSIIDLKESYRQLMLDEFKNHKEETKQSAELEWDKSWEEIIKTRDALRSFRNFDIKNFHVATKDEDFDFIDSDSDN